MTKDKLKEAYYDTKIGYVSIRKFYEKMKKLMPDITFKELKEFYDSQEINQIMKETKRPKVYNSVVANYPKDIYEMDLIVYNRYEINHYKYILCMIDIYSRYAQAIPLTNNKLETITETLKKLFEKMGPPRTLKLDNEFNKKTFINFIEDYNIILKFSEPYEINKNPIVERFNRTLARNLNKIRVATQNYKWYKYIYDVVENYNNTIHSTTMNTPISIFKGDEFNEQQIINKPITFKIGDKVRIILHKKIFDKGDLTKYSDDIYTVEGIKGKKIKLNDGNYYKDYEVKKISDIVYKNKYKDEFEEDIKEYKEKQKPTIERRITRGIKKDYKKLLEG